MKEISILFGGEAGEGIKQAGAATARLLNRLGYRIFLYDDYPSLVKGGHNFSIIRGSDKKIRAHKNDLDIIVALNQETEEKHKWRLKSGGAILYDSSKVEAEGIGVPFSEIVKELKGLSVMRNTAAIGALAKCLDIEWSVVEELIHATMEIQVDLNLRIAQKAYDKVNKPHFSLTRLVDTDSQPLLTGNQAIALGAVQGGLNMYIAYPMTPASGILHYLAQHEDELGIVTFQPENEIAVALMALGGAYAGAKTMVGTSGGGFALMTEALSFAGQTETPMVIAECQRGSPGTGIPTYTMQADLLFVIHAGHGDFVKLVLAPGDAEEAFYLTELAMKFAWEFQIQSIILSDKHLSESTFSFEANIHNIEPVRPKLWQGGGEYKRYLNTNDGVSPLAFPGNISAVVKANSNEYDEFGLTIQDPEGVKKMQKKRMRKKEALIRELSKYEQVKIYGNKESKTVLFCWGSTKGACIEAAENLDIKVVQPLVMEPFPAEEIKSAIFGAKKVIDVELNAGGQLADILSRWDIPVDYKILRYDAQPFTVDTLLEEITEVL